MTDINQFSFDNVTTLATSANQLVNQYVVSPLVGLGIAGFVFDIVDDTRIDLRADITDHYTENNTAIQDCIAIRPEIVTLRGYVGEVVNTINSTISSLTQLTEKLTILNSYVPIITNFAQQTRSVISSQNNTIGSYVQAAGNLNIYGTFKKLNPPPTKQAQAFNFFRALFQSKQLVSLETPYSFYSQMAIESLSATQSGKSLYVSDFSITLKEIRTVSTSTVPFDATKYQGRSADQSAPIQDKGVANGTVQTSTERTSVLQNLANGIGLNKLISSF